MIKSFWDKGPKKSLQFQSDEDDIKYDDADDYMSDVDDEMSLDDGQSDTDKAIDGKLTSENGTKIQVMTNRMM